MDEWMTVGETAHRLRVSVETIRRLIRSGALRASSLETPPGRGGYRIRRSDLEALLVARARGGVPQDRDGARTRTI